MKKSKDKKVKTKESEPKQPKVKKEKVKKTPEQKQEIKKGILTGLLAFLAVVAVVSVGIFYIKSRNIQQGTEPKKEVTDLASITLSSKSVITPYVTTGIDSVVYTVNTAREISFFEFDGKEYSQLPETGSADITVPLSGQQIPVSMHYIQKDGKTAGFGVYTADADSDVYIYDFMLVKMTDLPAGYEKDGKYLLLASTDRSSIYSLDPVWEEAYYLTLSSGATERFLLEGNRMLDIKGAVRPDFCMMTDGCLAGAGKTVPFFSSREYETTLENMPVDIYVKNGNDETLAVKGVADKYVLRTDDGGFIYIRETEGGFNAEKYLDGEITTVSEFFSYYNEELIRMGNYILSRVDGRLYSLADGSVTELPDFKMTPSQVAVSPDGKYLVAAGTVTNVLDYQIYIYNFETGACKSFADSDYSEHCNLFFASPSSVCFYTENAEGYNERVIDVSRIS
ncbi:MAG: hypothetical protein E7514_00215 [Ruminococcaceae bacterium]|nr:hypothetical protein [Oscillospiraceae bacterium]